MTTPGYQEGAEPKWWWKVAHHVQEAETATMNAMVHNLDDQKLVFEFQDKLKEAQKILLEIFRVKGLAPKEPAPAPKAPDPKAGG